MNEWLSEWVNVPEVVGGVTVAVWTPRPWVEHRVNCTADNAPNDFSDGNTLAIIRANPTAEQRQQMQRDGDVEIIPANKGTLRSALAARGIPPSRLAAIDAAETSAELAAAVRHAARPESVTVSHRRNDGND